MFRFGLIGFLVVAAPFARGQFSVGDDFSTLSGNWFNESTTGTGAFNVSVGGTEVLNYLDGGLAASGTSTGSRDWMSNTGSYAQNWQVQIDFTFNLTQVDGQSSSWSLYIGNLADAEKDDIMQGYFQLTTSGVTPSLMLAGLFNTDGSMAGFPYEPKQKFDPASTVTLKATYVAATHILSLYYDADGSGAGRGFELVTSAPVDATGLNWGMTNSDAFGFRLAASNNAGSTLTDAILAGEMFADNFAAASAIPEPATYAAVFGVLALLAAGWRRRQG